ncbi:hypothetical protein MN116_007334 [Schistosoma mekongi]|uniref:Small VCP/p97-interacting protein n=1 Tax=Schistosoma mekongi TaxID=38744 RepID=A0AAE1Z8Z8_SCHME|nr:hypothetical protein MN116_007334 [Schistosoma mekongi]
MCERLFCCFRSSSYDSSQINYESYSGSSGGGNSIDPETRRRLQAEAAERRVAENESRGIADIEKVRRKQELAEELEKKQYGSGMKSDNALRWNVN